MINDNNAKELSIGEVLNDKKKYIIPMYQRNYSWTDIEINQLLDDIRQAQKQGKSNYYIGSLVVSEAAGHYEVVDGQQRLTTLNLIKLYLDKNFDKESINIEFEYREHLSKFIENKKYQKDPIKNNIFYGYNHIEAYFKKENIEKEKEKEKEKEEFENFLLDNVKIYRTILPDGTDLNRYFEIMNNRGEQLENHEVIKAKLMDKISGNENKNLFAHLWDACSDMSQYALMGLNTLLRKELISKNTYLFNNLLGIYLEANKKNEVELNNGSTSELKPTIQNILSEKYSLNNKIKIEDDVVVNEKYGSVIDFQNFLMMVLKIYLKDTDNKIPLDDKHIIDSFSILLEEKEEKITKFMGCLLKCRLLFDSYIIKNENEKKEWVLKKLNDKYKPVNSFNKENEESDNEENDQKNIRYLLSMFHFSFPSKTYKTWFYDVMCYLNENSDISSYASFLENLAAKYYNERTSKNDSEENNILNSGTSVPNYIFNYLDYLLWKEWEGKNKGKGKNTEFENTFKKFLGLEGLNLITDNKDKLVDIFNNFKFTYRNSVEHCFPQSQKEGLNNIDHFGNLCLVHSSINSSLGDGTIGEKRSKILANENSPKSLKQILMFMLTDDCWSKEKVTNTIKVQGEAFIKFMEEKSK